MGRRQICWALVLLAGCYRSTDVADAGTDAGPSIGERVREWLIARDREMCRREIACEPYETSDLFAHWPCHPSSSDADEYAESVESGDLTFDARAAEECLRVLGEGSDCLVWWEVEDCFPFEGARREGDACEGLYEGRCGPDLYCNPDTCRCTPGARLGAPCGTWAQCVDVGWCHYDTRICVPLPAHGTSCDTRFDCGSDAPYCVDGACSADGAPLDHPCQYATDCAPELWCDYRSNVCAERLDPGEECLLARSCGEGSTCVDAVCAPLRSEGEACRFDDQCEPVAPFCVGPRFGEGVCSADATGNDCVVWPPGHRTDPPACPDGWGCVANTDEGEELYADGTCQPRVGLGDPCEHDRSCPDGSRCEDGLCVHVVMPDQPCGPDAACPRSHVCEAGECDPRPVLGEPCDAEHRCFDSACVEGVCGRAPAGTPCRYGLECTGACSYETRRCVEPVGEGEGCGSPDRFCANGLICAFGLETPVCIATVCRE